MILDIGDEPGKARPNEPMNAQRQKSPLPIACRTDFQRSQWSSAARSHMRALDGPGVRLLKDGLAVGLGSPPDRLTGPGRLRPYLTSSGRP
jgi:hypothetical protein